MKISDRLISLENISDEDMLKFKISKMKTTLIDKFKAELDSSLNKSEDISKICSLMFAIKVNDFVPETESSISLEYVKVEQEKSSPVGDINHEEMVNIMQWMIENRKTYEDGSNLDWTGFINNLESNMDVIKNGEYK